VTKKGTFELEEFDGTRVPGTHPGNRLKKFVKREGFYEPVEYEGDEEEEEGEVVDEVTNDRRNEGKAGFEAEIEPKGFEVRVPTLAPA